MKSKIIAKGGIDSIIVILVILGVVVGVLVAIAPNLSESSKATSEKQIETMTQGQPRIIKTP